MHRIIIIMALAVASLLSIDACAQTGLNVAPFFSEEYASEKKLTSVTLTGEKCGKLGLRVYKSVSVTDDAPLANRIRRAVAKDGAKATLKEVAYRGGELYFGLYSMGGKGAGRRYLIFLNRRPAGQEKTILVYIEGNISEETVKKLIKR